MWLQRFPPSDGVTEAQLVAWLALAPKGGSERASRQAAQRRARILWTRYCAAVPATIEGLAAELNVSRSRVSDIESRALYFLRRVRGVVAVSGLVAPGTRLWVELFAPDEEQAEP
ncbi:MAG: sigma factor-like helix-turn-helix DNA-binding protein [Chloroflexota bacterium]